ncbi:hypothetical protein OAO65_02320, partial [Flavobacteriales bacterium]|nr:hypothetical protein [Flavobacteriales bacterium]
EDNQIVTDGMFHERDSNETWTQFTLMPWDIQSPYDPTIIIKSLHQLYVECGDVSEYRFATEHFYNFAHWELIKSLDWFIPHYNAMRQELEAKLESEAVHAMRGQVRSGTATQSTLKYFADREYTQPDTTANADKDAQSVTPDKDWLLNQAKSTYHKATKDGNLAAANVALKTIGQHTDVDAFAADKVEVTEPIQVIINGDLSKV